MAQLIFLYLLLAVSGAGLTSVLRLRGVLDNVLMTFSFGAAQLLVSIQALSLFSKLTPWPLLVANLCVTICVLTLTRRTLAEFWKFFRADVHGLLAEFGMHQRRSAGMILIAAALVCVIFQTLTAWLMYPTSDIYHFVMPLFWRQNQTVLPFPAYDPRLIGVVFLSEALCLPGYLYAHTAAMFSLVSGMAAILIVCLVIAMARHAGATAGAALCAGALIVGYGPMAHPVLGAKADMLISALWFGASIHFLLRTKSHLYPAKSNTLVGCSVFVLAMACGTKNVILILIPVYAASLLLLCGRAVFSKKAALTILTAGATGMLVSGVIWSYASNLGWFGDLRGPQFLKETLSKDFRPRAVWTRVARGTVMLLSDVIWLPGSQQKRYAELCQRAVTALGGRKTIAEDHGFYSFRAENIRPGTSFGLLGSMIFLPSLVFAGWMSLRIPRAGSWLTPGQSLQNTRVLLLLTIGSFATYHAFLRWQTIGISRLMLPCLTVGAPLAAFLMERSWPRRLALPLTLGVMLVYSISGFGLATRRLGVSTHSGLMAWLSRLQRDHSVTVEWRWQNGLVEKQSIRESYTRREIVRALLRRIPQPTTFGLIGGQNAEGYYLFGDGFLNKVISIKDCRGGDRFVPPPSEVEFLVTEDFEPSAIPREILRGFQPLVQVEHDGKPILTVFQRSPTRTATTTKIKSESPP
jgi:hypothetical protein